MTEKNRQSKSVVEVEGIVESVNLEHVKVQGVEKIRGTVKIDVGNSNIVEVNAFANAVSSQGNPSGLQTVMNEYQIGDKVRTVYAGFRENKYIKGDGNLASFLQVSGNVFNRVDEVEPKAKFIVEMVISGFKEEIVRGTEDERTGKKFVNGYGFDYNGDIYPIQLVTEGKLADAVEDKFEVGQTAIFHGIIKNVKKSEKIIVKADFGEDIEEEKVTYERGFIIKGGRVVEDDEDNKEKPYETDVVKKALAKRKELIQEMKDKKDGAPATSSNSVKNNQVKKKSSDPFGEEESSSKKTKSKKVNDDPFADDNEDDPFAD